MTAPARPSLKRRWERFTLRAQGYLDGENADRMLPWLFALIVFALYLSLEAAALRSLNGGSGIAPWVQASWRRSHGGVGVPVGGADPATASWSFISEPILLLTRVVPTAVCFAVIQAAMVSLGVVPLWRLARNNARLRVGAASVVVIAYALAPTLHRANLSPFHPELIALPALLAAYVQAQRAHWVTYSLLVGIVLLCRADLGLTIAALGLVVAWLNDRRNGLITTAVGVAWTLVAVVVLDPQVPSTRLTPAGEFVARATTPLAEVPQVLIHPFTELRAIFAEPSVLFLVVVLAPLLFLPLVSLRRFAAALPCLVLAILADRSVQRVTRDDVLSLSPAAAHVAPAMAFVFLALVFALERIGTPSITRVNVDRRVLMALLAGCVLFFVTEAPSSPYRQPWNWGGRTAIDDARVDAADLVADSDSVAVSPSATVLVAERGHLRELPPDPAQLTPALARSLGRNVDRLLLDTNDIDPRTGQERWTPELVREVLVTLHDAGFTQDFRAEGVYLYSSGR